MSDIKYVVTLDDKYTPKTGKIVTSTNVMAKAMEKAKATTVEMGKSLKSAFNTKTEVKISEVGIDDVRYKLTGLQNHLKSMNKDLDLSIEASPKLFSKDNFKGLTNGFKDIAKGGFGSISKKFGGFKKSVIDKTSLVNARIEAFKLSRELTKLTGTKHKIKVESDTKGFMSNLKSKLSSGFSKINHLKMFSKRDKEADAGGGGASMLKSIVGGNLISGAISKGIGAITSASSAVIGGGFNRLKNMELSQARLKAQGYDTKEIKEVTDSAISAVTGTQYGLGDAMMAASGALAAGIDKSGLEEYLKEVGNAAAATGSDFTEISSIMNKVMTTGHLQADEMRQLSDRGLPMLAKLAENAGISVEEMSKKISKGEVTFEQFREAVKSASGTAAEEVAKTFGGAKDNFKSALSKIGSGILSGSKTNEDGSAGGIFGMITPGLLKLNDLLNSKIVPVANAFGDKLGEIPSKFQTILPKIQTLLEPLKNLPTIFSQLGGFIQSNVMPAFQAIGEWIQINLFPVFESLGGFIMDSVVPALSSLAETFNTWVLPVLQDLGSYIVNNVLPTFTQLASWVLDNLLPVFIDIAEFLGSILMPVFSVLAEVAGTVLKGAFEGLKLVIDVVTGVFDLLVGAVRTVSEKISGIAGNIKGFFTGKEKNATGTTYFGGGLTRINERGEEMIQLSRGDKIYPAGKTEKIIKNDINRNSNNTDKSVVNAPITINLYGNNDEKKVAKSVSDELKRLGVVV